MYIAYADKSTRTCMCQKNNLLILFVYINPPENFRTISHMGCFKELQFFFNIIIFNVNLQKVLHSCRHAQEIQEIMVEDLEKTLAGIASDIKPWELEAPVWSSVGLCENTPLP